MALNDHRPIRKKRKGFVEPEEPWKDLWWGMPTFEMKDATPQYRIVMNFMTKEDIKRFAEKLGINVTSRTDSAWYPPQKRLKSSEFEYIGEPTDTKYPVCIPSKGRAETQTTGLLLDRMGVSYKFFVEEKEGRAYKRVLGRDKVIVMP